MFFEFTSKRIPPQEQWPLLWEIENRIASLLLEEADSLRKMSGNKLKEYLHEKITKDSHFPGDVSHSGDASKFLQGYLGREIDHLHSFLDRTPTVDSHMIRLTDLDRCLANSDEFRVYIEKKGKAADEYFDDLSRDSSQD